MRFPYVLRSVTPEMALPFYPRSVGTNYFRRGSLEVLPPSSFVEICWVLSGECRFDLDGKPWAAHAGQSLFRLPGEFRRKFSMADDTRIYWLTFDGAGAEAFMKSFGYPRRPLDSGPCPEHLFESIAKTIMLGTPNELRKSIALYTEIIVRMSEPDVELSPRGKLIENALYFINRGYGNVEFNITALAELLHVHRTTLDRVFRRETNISPLECLNRCRIRHACELLDNTGLEMVEIARRTGFSRSNYFARMFRRETGFSPMEYRKEKRRLPDF